MVQKTTEATVARAGAPWCIEAVADGRRIESRLVGGVSEDELGCAVREWITAADVLGYRLFLVDCSELTSHHSPAMLFQLATEVRQMPVGDRAREAILVPNSPEALASARIWETTASNPGLVVRLFVDRAAAIGWLMEGAGSTTSGRPPVTLGCGVRGDAALLWDGRCAA